MTLFSRRSVVGLVLICIGISAQLQADVGQDVQESKEFLSPIKKGAGEFAILGGVGIAHEIWDGVGDIQVYIVGVRVGRVVSGPRGPGFLRGNLEVAGEFLPVFLVDQETTSYGASATFLARHFFAPDSQWRPYGVVGFGVLGTADEVPEGQTRLNFTPQIGLGISYASSERFVFYFDYRIHHISNGGRKQPNPGINSSAFQFSVSVLRW
jgi:hypothetical protein